MRLAALDQHHVASLAARRVAATMQRLALALSPGLQWRATPDADETLLPATDLYMSVSDLLAYAQDGRQPDEAEDLLLSVLGALLARPLDADTAGRDLATLVEELEDDSEDELVLLCVAAVARLTLQRGGRLSSRQVASLAGLAPSRVRALSAAGELPSATEPTKKAGTWYRAADVRRFLSGRGVGGFD